MNRIETITVRELRAGDQVVDGGRDVYRVTEVVRDDMIDNAELVLRVQWVDGGFDLRTWDGEQLNQRVEVIRAGGGA